MNTLKNIIFKNCFIIKIYIYNNKFIIFTFINLNLKWLNNLVLLQEYSSPDTSNVESTKSESKKAFLKPMITDTSDSEGVVAKTSRVSKVIYLHTCHTEEFYFLNNEMTILRWFIMHKKLNFF